MSGFLQNSGGSGTITGSGADGYVTFFAGDATNIAGDNDLYWDRSNNRLGVGTTSPRSSLHVKTDVGLIVQYDNDDSNSIYILHNGTDGYIYTLSGDLQITSTNGSTIITEDFYANSDAYVAGNLGITGQSWNDMPSTLVPSGTTQNINWDDGAIQVVDLEDASGDVTLTFSNPKAGATYVLEIIQDSAVARDITWPAEVLWPGGVTPVITAGANAVDVVSIYYNGTSYYADIGQDYS